MQFKLEYNFSNSITELLIPIEFINKGKGLTISNVASVFDIEASSFYDGLEKRATMYAWTFGVNGKSIRGRTWKEFLDVCDTLVQVYGLDINKRFIIYVHNLSYEFQWFRNYFEWEKIFSNDDRKPIFAITKNGIEFRDSYILSGYSLEKVGENLTKYKVNKLVGDLDYSLIRHSLTPLNDKEWGYILNDGLVVMSYIQELIERLGSIGKIPYTNTGFVRNLCKKNCLESGNGKSFTKEIHKMNLTPFTYDLLKKAFMGGFTHANHNKVDKVFENIASYDFTSSYPSVMISEFFPMSTPKLIQIENKEDFNEKLEKYCCLFSVIFYDLEATFDHDHYISKSKCLAIEEYLIDNGRVVNAEKLQIVLTELDYKIISKTYKWSKMEIGSFHIMRKDYLPKDIIKTILDLYKDKTELKGVENKEVEYLVSKGMLNSVYGMCVTDICKDEVIYENGIGWNTNKANIDLLIENYNKSSQRFLFYAWGIWTTAYARFNLWSGILEFGQDYIYADTDSLKVLNYENHLDYINEYNKNIIKKVNKCLYHYRIGYNYAKPKTIEGVEKPIGVWDFEGVYKLFKTLGAKRYIYLDQKDKIHITISGVSKKNGVNYLMYKYKGNVKKIFKEFKDGLEFPAEYENEKTKTIEKGCGKLTHTYIDSFISGYVIDYLGNENIYNETSCVHLENTSYKMGLDTDFINYLLGIKRLK